MGFLDSAGLARVWGKIETALKGKLDITGGELAGDLSLSGNRLLSVCQPENPNDGANKDYVDSAIQTAITGAIKEAY